MEPPSSQQQTPPIHHIMTVPEKIELTATGGYPSPQNPGPRQDTGYRTMRVPDKITLESAGEVGAVRGEGREGEGDVGRQAAPVSGGIGRYYQPTQALGSEPPFQVPDPSGGGGGGGGGLGEAGPAIQDLERRVVNLEKQLHTLRQAVLQQGGRGGPASQGYGVWYILTFAGWLMVPLVAVFMLHYRKNVH